MNLDDAQKKKVAAWIEEGLKLSDIQKKIATELGLNLTYMEVRFLMTDLGLQPKDKPEPPPTPPPADAKGSLPPGQKTEELAEDEAGAVKVTVDQVTRPGALASGKVTFSDGKSADWYLDQTGRLGLAPKEPGYKPPEEDIMEFQMELQSQLARLGY